MLAVAAILAQPDDAGHQHLHPVAYDSRKLTAAEMNSPAHVLELLSAVHALCVLRRYVLGGGTPRQARAGCWSDFDLRTDSTRLESKRHLSKWFLRWLGWTRARTAAST